MNKQLILNKIKNVYVKYDDYINYNFYIIFTLLIYPFFILILPSLFFNILIPIIAIPIIFYKYFKKKNYNYLSFRTFIIFIFIWGQFGGLSKFDMFHFQFKFEIYYYLLSSLSVIALLINNKIKITTVILNIIISLVFHIIILFIALNGFDKFIFSSLSWYSLLHFSFFSQLINVFIYYDRKDNHDCNCSFKNSEYLKLSILIIFLVVDFLIFKNYKEDLYSNKVLNNNLNKFIATEYTGTVKMEKIKNKLFKFKYNNQELIFVISNVYKCNTYNYPDFLIDFKDVETLQISKSKDSDRFSFQLNGQCVEADVSLSN